jgi:hypothetical protein
MNDPWICDGIGAVGEELVPPRIRPAVARAASAAHLRGVKMTDLPFVLQTHPPLFQPLPICSRSDEASYDDTPQVCVGARVIEIGL